MPGARDSAVRANSLRRISHLTDLRAVGAAGEWRILKGTQNHTGEFAVPPRLATRVPEPQHAPAPPAARAVVSAVSLTDAVAARVGAARFNLWFQGHATFVPLGGRVVVAARNQHTQEWLEHTFGAAVKAAVAEVCGAGTTLQWVVDDLEEGARGQGAGAKSGEPQPAPARSEPTAATKQATRPSPLAPRPSQVDLFGDPVAPPKPKAKRADPDEVALARPLATQRTGRRWKSLADFVAGPCNRVAHASALRRDRGTGAGGEPARHSRPGRHRQDAPARRHLRGHEEAERSAPVLRHRGGVHHAVRAGVAAREDVRVPAAVPRVLHAAPRRPALPRHQEGDAGRVPAHLRRARRRRPAGGCDNGLSPAAGGRTDAGTASTGCSAARCGG